MMKYLRSLVIFILFSAIACFSYAQGILPDITVRELTKGKVQISWNNPYETCIQLAIQRSTDSANNFRTIFSSQSPELPSNGYVDNKPLRGIKSYYRIFYVLQGGAYYFSKIMAVDIKWENPTGTAGTAPVIGAGAAKDMISIFVKGSQVFNFTKTEYARFRDSINRQTSDGLSRINANSIEWIPRPVKRDNDQQLVSIYGKDGLIARMSETAYRKFKDSIAGTRDTLYMIDPYRIQLRSFAVAPGFISVFRNDSLVRQLEIPLYRRFRDSMATTRDTLFVINTYKLEIHPFTPRYVWRPSAYVFTNAKGYVTILLPLIKQRRYRIVFYEDEAHTSEVFQVRSLKEPEMVLDKANFMHAGWFYFELFEDDKLKEKNKFFLSKD